MSELLTIVAAMIAVALAAMALYQAASARVDARKFPPPGRMVNVAGSDGTNKQLHVVKMGAGRSAVLLESGISTTSLNWSLLQPELAAFVSTYSYDRAGLGWSDTDGAACSVARIAEDLHALVGAIDIPAPYILVAHSFGGYIARYYVSKFPEELAGVVLVDPLTPEEWIAPTEAQWKTLRKASRYARLGGALASIGVARICFGVLQSSNRETSGHVISKFGAGVTNIARRIAGELGKLSPEVQRLVQMQWSCSKPYWSMSKYLRALPASAAEAANCVIPENIPVTVISGNHQPPERLNEHAAIAKHSAHGKHIIAKKSGHWIQFDEPELIIDAVRHMGTVTAMADMGNPREELAAPQPHVGSRRT